MRQIRVLIVDDSAFMRHALGRLLSEAPSISVVGAAANGLEGLELARTLRPDVITLDVEMPVLDGIGMLHRLMLETPTRVVMLSSLTTENARVTLDALECGAIDFVSKPSGSLSIDVGRVGGELVAKIEAAAGMPEASFLHHRRVAAMNLSSLASRSEIVATTGGPVAGGPAGGGQAGGAPAGGPGGPGASGPAGGPVAGGPQAGGFAASGNLPRAPRPQTLAAARAPRPRSAARIAARKLVVVASSTGGPGALHALVGALPARLDAAVIIVQHMPPGFTASLAARLDASGRLPCAEATSDDVAVADEILVAPGDMHLISSRSGHIQLVRLPAVNGVRPAADVTLQAVAPIWRERLLCVVLTGMGSDGREGARAVKQHGGTVIAQDRATATIYGMPAAVAEAGLADRILPLPQIAGAIASWCGVEAGRTDGAERAPHTDRGEQPESAAMAS